MNGKQFHRNSTSPMKNYTIICSAWINSWSMVLVFVVFLCLACPGPVCGTPVSDVSDCTYIGQGEIFQDITITVDDPFQGAITRTFDFYVPPTLYPPRALKSAAVGYFISRKNRVQGIYPGNRS